MYSWYNTKIHKTWYFFNRVCFCSLHFRKKKKKKKPKSNKNTKYSFQTQLLFLKELIYMFQVKYIAIIWWWLHILAEICSRFPWEINSCVQTIIGIPVLYAVSRRCYSFLCYVITCCVLPIIFKYTTICNFNFLCTNSTGVYT